MKTPPNGAPPAPPAETQPPPPPPPTPENRVIKPGMVKVRAKGHLHEGGYRKPGEEFETTDLRAKALGNLVDLIKVL